jgi:hypothetical protein
MIFRSPRPTRRSPLSGRCVRLRSSLPSLSHLALAQGGIAYFQFDIPNMGQIFMIQVTLALLCRHRAHDAGEIAQSHTPLKPMLLDTRFRWWADPNIPRVVSRVPGRAAPR